MGYYRVLKIRRFEAIKVLAWYNKRAGEYRGLETCANGWI